MSDTEVFDVDVRVMGDEATVLRFLAHLAELVELGPIKGPWPNRRQGGVRAAVRAIRARRPAMGRAATPPA